MDPERSPELSGELMTQYHFSEPDSPSKNTRDKGDDIATKTAYAWLISKKLFEQLKPALMDKEIHPYHYCVFHDEDCHKLKAKGDHFHLVIWTTNERYSDSKIVRRFRAIDPYKQEWSYEKVRKIDAMLLYLNNHEKTFISSCVTTPMQNFIDALPKESQNRMDDYILKRDMSKKAYRVPDMVKILKQYHCTTYDQLSLTLASIAHKNHKDEQELLLKITSQQNIRFVTTQANEYLRKENTAKTPLEHIMDYEARHEHDEEYYQQHYTVERTREWIKKILDYNHIDYKQACHDIAHVLLKYTIKRNCIWIHGPSNAGKSIFLLSIADMYPTHGQLLPSKDFMFQDCQDQPIIFSEETSITQEIVSDWKKVAEGTTIHANKKYKEAYELFRTPMICASNETPWRHVMTEYQALKNRILYYEFKPYPELINCTKALNPSFWKHHLLRAEHEHNN